MWVMSIKPVQNEYCYSVCFFLIDYVGFIKKCMKLMQKPDYNQAKKIDLEIQQLDDAEAPRTPGIHINHVSFIIARLKYTYIVLDKTLCVQVGFEFVQVLLYLETAFEYHCLYKMYKAK